MGILDRLFGGGNETAAPTPSKQGGSYAGAKLGNVAALSEPPPGMKGQPLPQGNKGLERLAKGVAVVDGVFNVASILNNNQKGKETAREIAANLVDAGYTDYDQVMALAQGNSALESQIGDIGVSDYAKTLAGVGLQAQDLLTAGPLGLITAPLGAIAQVDLQRKKAGRNEAFREQFTQELINRGLV